MKDKFVSTHKIARIAKMQDANLLFELRHYEHLSDNVIKNTTHLSAIVIHGMFVYTVHRDYSQKDKPQPRGRRHEFANEELRDRWLDASLNRSDKRARFSVDEILMNPDSTVMTNETELKVSLKSLF